MAIVNRLTKAYRSPPPLQSNPSLSPSEDLRFMRMCLMKKIQGLSVKLRWKGGGKIMCRINAYILYIHALDALTCFTYDSLESQSDGSVHQKDGCKTQTVLSDKVVFEGLALKPFHGQLSDICVVLFCTLVRLLFVPLKCLFQSTE